MAIDFGERRIGVAVSDETATIASPLEVIQRRSKAEDFARLARLAQEHGVGGLIIGLPLNANGTEGYQAKRVRRYAAGLRQALQQAGLELVVEFWDESLSTIGANEAMIAAGRGAKARRARIDAAAAALILRDYLEAQRHKALHRTGEDTA
jgi:putative Holliday junction resolvase